MKEKKKFTINIRLALILMCLFGCIFSFGVSLLLTVPSNASAEEKTVIAERVTDSASYGVINNNGVIKENSDYSLYTPEFTVVDGELRFKDKPNIASDSTTLKNLKAFETNNPWYEVVPLETINEETQKYYLGFAYVTDYNFFGDKVSHLSFSELKEKYGFEYKLYNERNFIPIVNVENCEQVWELPQPDTAYYFFRFTYVERYANVTERIPLGGGSFTSEYTENLILDRSPIAPMRPAGACVEWMKNYRATGEQSELFKAMHKFCGTYTEADSTISVNYIKMNDFSTYTYATHSVTIPSEFIYNRYYIENYSGLSLTDDTILKWNASYKDYYILNGDELILSERIIRQAIGFDYEPNVASNTGRVNINYSEFKAKDVCLRITNNDPENLLTANIYTTDLTAKNGDYILTFNIQTVLSQLQSAYDWTVLSDLTFEIDNPSANVDVTNDSKLLTVSVPMDKEGELFGLSITCVAEIVDPNTPYDMVYKYVTLNEDLSESIQTSETITTTYGEILKYNVKSFYNEYGAVIDSAISPVILAGEVYYKYSGIISNYDNDLRTCEITVIYDYNALLLIKNSLGAKIYKALDDNTMTFKAKDFDFNVTTGYRICNITSNSNKVRVDYVDTNPGESVITVQANVLIKEIYEICAELTDLWHIEITYLERYKESAFFEETTFKGDVKVSDYSDIYNLTENELLSILGKESFDLLGLTHVNADKIVVEFNNIDTYSVDLVDTYTSASMRKLNSDGTYTEVLVKPTSYAVWCDMYGESWSILWLNNKDEKFFTYEDDVDRAKLYGLFSVATFNEQQTDLNGIFAEYSSNGCKTVYESRKVKGSDLYKWFDRNKNNVGATSLSYVGIWGCELANSENHVAYSYFFYLDGTSDLNYVANNGADSIDDTDSAFEDTVKDSGTDVKDFFHELWYGDSVGAIIFKVILGIIALIALVLIVFFFIKLIKILIRWIKGD